MSTRDLCDDKCLPLAGVQVPVPLLSRHVAWLQPAARQWARPLSVVDVSRTAFGKVQLITGRILKHSLEQNSFARLPTFARTCAVVTATALGALTTAGCGMSSLTSGLGTSVFGSSAAPKNDVKLVSEDQLLSAAKTADGTAPAAISADAGGCPRFVVGARDNNLTIYETGRVGDGLAIIHRGEITKTGRECQIEPGKVTIKYGFAGRVLLGPKGKSGTIKLPVTITVTDAKRAKVASDTIKVDVDIAVDKPIGYFSAVKSISIPIPEGSRPGEFEVLVGFDRAVPGAG